MCFSPLCFLLFILFLCSHSYYFGPFHFFSSCHPSLLSFSSFTLYLYLSLLLFTFFLLCFSFIESSSPHPPTCSSLFFTSQEASLFWEIYHIWFQSHVLPILVWKLFTPVIKSVEGLSSSREGCLWGRKEEKIIRRFFTVPVSLHVHPSLCIPQVWRDHPSTTNILLPQQPCSVSDFLPCLILSFVSLCYPFSSSVHFSLPLSAWPPFSSDCFLPWLHLCPFDLRRTVESPWPCSSFLWCLSQWWFSLFPLSLLFLDSLSLNNLTCLILV